MYSYLILLFLFAAGIIFYTVQQTHRLMQMDMDYMDQANQQMNLTLDMVEDNAENLRYLHFADETMRTILMRTGENFTQEEQWEAGAYIRNFLAVETDLDDYLCGLPLRRRMEEFIRVLWRMRTVIWKE